MLRKAIAIALLLVAGGCSQAGNTANSLCVVWVGPGTSAVCTINAQATVTPAAPATLPTLPLPLK
jgi:hypothetical protein